MLIRGRKIGADEPVYLVAEIGVNHDGEPALARKLVADAASAGADAVKFQGFVPTAAGLPDRKDLESIRRLALTADHFGPLAAQAHRLGLAFILSPFDASWIESCGWFVDAWKVPSSRNRDAELMGLLSATAKPLIISLGMSAAGPLPAAALLHCVSAYPPRWPNLRRVAELVGESSWCGEPTRVVGYSDHTGTMLACIQAVTLGAAIVEVHVTHSRETPGPDHAISFERAELAALRMVLDQAQRNLRRPPEGEDQEAACKATWGRGDGA